MIKTVETEKYFCDFCGEEIKRNTRPFSITVILNDDVVFEYGGSKYDWDLCPKCADKLFHVFCKRMEGYIPERYTFDDYKYRDECKKNCKEMM